MMKFSCPVKEARHAGNIDGSMMAEKTTNPTSQREDELVTEGLARSVEKATNVQALRFNLTIGLANGSPVKKDDIPNIHCCHISRRFFCKHM